MKKSLLFFILISLISLKAALAEGHSGTAALVHVWKGTFNNDWYNPANWEPADVPNASDSVIVPGYCMNSPVIDTTGSTRICRGLDLESTGKASRAGLTISGGEIVIDGSLTIKAGATLTIESDGALTVNGDVKIVLTGSLIVESGGSLITNGSITGIANVKRIIPNDMNWHFLSCPVTSHNILNGVFAPTAANFTSTPIDTWDFYKFNADCVPLWWLNLRTTDGNINTTDFGNPPSFAVRSGYLVAYGSGFATTKVFTGTPNTGDQTYNLTSGVDDCGWNLLGNPYPSALSWDNITDKGNLSNGYYYIWNENKVGGPGYEAYLDENFKTPGSNGNIPSMQGFFVIAKPDGGKTIGIPNSARLHDSDNWMKNSSASRENTLTLKFGNGTSFDETHILFSENGTIGQDWYDADKILSLDETVPQIYSIIANSRKTMVNAMPYIDTPVVLPLGIRSFTTGEYSIRISGIETFNSLSNLTLEDTKLNLSQNMATNPVYTFTAAGEEDAGRFLLHFANTIGMNDQMPGSSINIFASQKTIFIYGNEASKNARITVYNLLGQEVLSQQLNWGSPARVTLNAPGGYYLVRVLSEGSVKTAKVNITD